MSDLAREQPEWGPTGEDVHWWTGTQPVYRPGDKALCCGCAIWVGRGVPECDCSCHDTARELWQRLVEVDAATSMYRLRRKRSR